MPRCATISSDRFGWVLPENTIIRLRVMISVSTELSGATARPPIAPLGRRFPLRLAVLAADAFVVPRDVALLGAFDPERSVRHVPGDRRAGSGPGALPDPYRRHEHGIRPDVRLVADDGPVLLEAVVVRGHGACPKIRSLADVRVAHVRQVRNLGALADPARLDLHERPRLGIVLDDRPRTAARVRADPRAPPDACVAHHG